MNNPQRIFFDTNVLLAAFAGEGLCHELFFHCCKHHTVLTSEEVLVEFERRLQTKLKMPSDARHAILKFFHRESVLVERRNLSDVQCRDPHDIPILEAAAGGNANYLVSGDKDLLVLKTIQRIPVLSPRELYQIIMPE